MNSGIEFGEYAEGEAGGDVVVGDPPGAAVGAAGSVTQGTLSRGRRRRTRSPTFDAPTKSVVRTRGSVASFW